jgi:hypothetical protein
MIRLWDAATRRVLRELAAHQSGVTCVALAPDGKALAAGGADGCVRLWDPGDGRLIAELPGHAGGVTGLAFGCDGLVLASAGRDAALRLWDRDRRKELKRVTGHTGAVRAVAFAPDSRFVASGGEDQTVRLWETVSGHEVACLRGHAAVVTAVAYAPDGRTLASGGWDGVVFHWDAADGRPVRRLVGRGGGVRVVYFTPDSRRLIAGGGRALRQWETATGRPAQTLANVPVMAAALAPDGNLLATGGADGLIRLWDPATVTGRGHLEGHRGPVVALAFGPGGKVLASVSTTVSVETHRPAGRPTGPWVAALSGPAPVIDPDQAWDDLAATDPRKALATVRALAAEPVAALVLLGARLAPVPPADGTALGRWVAEFLSGGEPARAQAAEGLLRLGDRAEPALRRAASWLPAGPERERVEELRHRIRTAPPTPEALRGLRAVELLVQVATPEARALLEGLAAGAPEAALTDAAAAALARLAMPLGGAGLG